MEQYIPKSALVAKINEIVKALNDSCNPDPFGSMEECMASAEIEALDIVLDTINTLEVKEVPIWEKVSPDTGQTTLYKDEDKSYLERFGIGLI